MYVQSTPGGTVVSRDDPKKTARGTFANVDSLIKTIMAYIHSQNQNPQAFVWTSTAERIMDKIAKCKEALGTLH